MKKGDKKFLSCLDQFALPSGAKVTCARFGPQSYQVLCAGDTNNEISLWRLSRPKPKLTLQGHSTEITCLSFSSSETEVYSGSFGGSIYVWDLRVGKEASRLRGHLTNCTCVTPDQNAGMFVASGAADTNVKLWDLRQKGCVETFKGHAKPATCVQF